MMTSDQLRLKVDEALKQPDLHDDAFFDCIKEAVERKSSGEKGWTERIEGLYQCVKKQILTSARVPSELVSFGTSGWRGILGRDLHCCSVAQVALAILEMYTSLDSSDELHEALGVSSFKEACQRGCVIGYDNRFAGPYLARAVIEVLGRGGIEIHYAGESTTGVLSAAVLKLDAAFSINLTPSHNPLEYGGFKFNAADAGPAAAEVTSAITARARRIIAENRIPEYIVNMDVSVEELAYTVQRIESLALWKEFVKSGQQYHGIGLHDVLKKFDDDNSIVVVIDSVHGASRLHIKDLLEQSANTRLVHLRSDADVTFGGVAPEPSSRNLEQVVNTLRHRSESLKLGAIIDPDGDRIRFTDGRVEISMNQFGAMAYHFLHQWKGKKGLVAKTVATSNFANVIAEELGEEVFEPRVGFKEFKPVIGKALVCFEESDGISIIGHTPEKDAYIGLVVALEIMLTTRKNLGDYLADLEAQYGTYYPHRDGIEVGIKGEELKNKLSTLEKYGVGESLLIGGEKKRIVKVIDIDGRKMIMEDGSWVMIRPSGTEPKVRFYVESRTREGTTALVEAAKSLLIEAGVEI